MSNLNILTDSSQFDVETWILKNFKNGRKRGKKDLFGLPNLWFNLRADLLCRDNVIFRIWPYRLLECQLANAIDSVFRLYVDGVCYCVWRLVRLWTQIPNSTEIRVETKGTDWCLFAFWYAFFYPYSRGAFYRNIGYTLSALRLAFLLFDELSRCHAEMVFERSSKVGLVIKAKLVRR